MKRLLILLLLVVPYVAFGNTYVEKTLEIFTSQGFTYEMCSSDTVYAKSGDYLIVTDKSPRTGMLVVSSDNRCVKYNETTPYKSVVVGVVKKI